MPDQNEVQSIARLDEGLDHVVYEVNGELIIRVSKESDLAGRSEAIQREVDLLAAVVELSTLPVPEPVFADTEAGVLAYVKLRGRPLMDHPVAEPARLAAPLGKFISRLHEAPVEKMEKLPPRDTDPLTTWREDAERAYREIA